MMELHFQTGLKTCLKYVFSLSLCLLYVFVVLLYTTAFEVNTNISGFLMYAFSLLCQSDTHWIPVISLRHKMQC